MRNFTLLCITILILSSDMLNAQVVDQFDYPAGESLETKAGGLEWKGSWNKVCGNEDQVIGEGGVTSLALAKKTSNNHLKLTHTGGSAGERYYRSLATPVSDDGNAYYLSYFMKTEWSGTAASNGSVNLIMLIDTASYAASGADGQLVQFGRVYGSENIGILKGGANKKVAGTNASDGHFVVVKIYMSGDDANEEFCMFIDPDLTTEPDTSKADLKSSQFNLNNGFNGIGFKIEGGKSISGEIDEIRFSSNYSEVVPNDLIDAPLAATEKFNQEAGTDLTTITENGNWGGPWEVISGGPLTTVEGGIENSILLTKTSGNKIAIDFTGSEQRFKKSLNTKFEDDGSTYYLSFSTKSIVGTDNTVSFVMLSDDSFKASGPDGQFVQIGKPQNKSFIGVGVGSTFALSSASVDEAHFVVAKIMTSGDDTGDSVAIFVDPDLAAEPQVASAAKLFGAKLNNGFSAIGIKVSGPGGSSLTTEYDDIMVGFDYASVIPDDMSEVAATSSIAKDCFKYNAGESLAGKGDVSNGWAGSWIAENDPDSSIFVNNGLLNESMLKRTKAPSVVITSPGTNNRYLRVFENPVDLAGGEFWFSFQMAVSGNLGGTAAGFILADTTQSNNQQVVIGKQYGNKNLFAAGAAGGGGSQTGMQFTDGEAKWVVGQMKPEDGKWKMNLWVNPDGATTPEYDSAKIKAKTYNGVTFNGVVIRSEGGAGCSLLIDDIFLGHTFESIVPDDWSELPEKPQGATEPFAYNAGTDSIAGLNGGDGFTGAYKILTGTNQPIAEEGIINYFNLKATNGPSLHFPLNSKARIVRPLAGEYGDNGRSFWFGWWQKNYGTGGGNVANIVLADTASFAGTGAGGHLMQIGKSWDGTIKMVGATQAKAEGIAWDTAHFYAAYIQTNGASSNDKVYLFVDPDVDSTPDLANANAVATVNLSTWNGIGFKVEGPDGVGAYFDEIRLAETFTEIIPADLVDVKELANPVAAYELFDYTVGEDLEGKNGGEGWSSAWVKNNGSIAVSEGSIDCDKVNTEGNKASISQDGSEVIYTRKFADKFGTKTSSVWMSCLLDITQKSSANESLVSLTLGENNVLSIGSVANQEKLAAVYNGETILTASDINASSKNWIVVRIDMDGTDEADNVCIWLNPAPDAIPTDANAQFKINDIDLNKGFDGLKIEASGEQTISTLFDAFRIGFSFREVSNKFVSSDPDLIAYEPFDYEVDSDLKNAGNIDVYWDGSWEDIGSMSTNSAKIESASLEIDDVAEKGNKVNIKYLADNTSVMMVRKLARPLPNDGSLYWLSFMMKSDNLEKLNNVANFSLNNTNISAKSGQRVGVGRIYGTGKMGIIFPSSNSSEYTTIDDTALNWVVLKVQTTGTEAKDTMWMWVNPDPNIEPNVAMVDLKRETSDMQQGIDAIMLKVAGAGGNQSPLEVQYDELRIAKTWSSLVPLNTSSVTIAQNQFEAKVYPNPFSNTLNVNYHIDEPSNVTIMVYNTDGRVLKIMKYPNQMAGDHTIRWNGLTDGGQKLTNGLYLIQISDGKNTTTRRLVFMK